MNKKEFEIYVLEECKRQWQEVQEAEGKGTWEEQSDIVRQDYFNQMYSDLSDNLTKACVDCDFVSTDNEKPRLFCKCPKSVYFEKDVTDMGITDCSHFKE